MYVFSFFLKCFRLVAECLSEYGSEFHTVGAEDIRKLCSPNFVHARWIKRSPLVAERKLVHPRASIGHQSANITEIGRVDAANTVMWQSCEIRHSRETLPSRETWHSRRTWYWQSQDPGRPSGIWQLHGPRPVVTLNLAVMPCHEKFPSSKIFLLRVMFIVYSRLCSIFIIFVFFSEFGIWILYTI